MFRGYLPASIIFSLGLLFYALPEFAALLLGTAFVSIGIVYAWLTHRFNMFNRYASERRFTSFEEDIFRSGRPGVKTFTSVVVKRFDT
jgi:hypothetical protein